MPDAGFLDEKVPEPMTPQPVEAPVQVAQVEAPQEDVSSVVADERAAEQTPEIADEFLEQAAEEMPQMSEGTQSSEQNEAASPAAAVPAPAPVAAPTKDEVVLEVEKILGEGLGEYFKAMPDDAKMRFRAKGEEAATQIADMVRSLHVQVKKVLELIRNWLLTIPGVNKFFLEQEAKIKTDRVLELERERREPPTKL